MPDATDMELMREFVRDHSETAFAEVVRRHVNLVYSVALRYAGQDGEAQDIAQAVFILLARKAAGLSDRTVLAGWLYETTRFTASRWLRTDARRHAREQEAYMQSLAPDSTATWQQLAPHLEAAMSQLAERDRTLLLLRFYENKSGPETAALLGIGEAAAQKGTARALEKLRKVFGKRGITLSAAGIAGADSANAVQSAPASLAAAITSGVLSGTALTTAAVIATKTIAMTTLQKTAVTAALTIAVGAGVYETRQNFQLRELNQKLVETKQTAPPPAGQIQQLQRERDEATNRLAAMTAELEKSKTNNLELLRLRALASAGRQAIADAERLRAQLAKPAAAGTNFLTSAMADAMTQAMEQQVGGQLTRMSASLQLAPDQVTAVSNILTKQSRLMSAGMSQAFAGKFDKDEILRLGRESGNPETQIKALLTPAQLAAYPIYQQEESAHTASLSANAELMQLQTLLDLSPAQSDSVYSALYNVSFDQLIGKMKPPTDAADAMQWTLEQKAVALEPFLTAPQLETYRQQIATQAKLAKDIMSKMRDAGIGK
jgi:RNA polymerase sigma factor (sigma-70 family)